MWLESLVSHILFFPDAHGMVQESCFKSRCLAMSPLDPCLSVLPWGRPISSLETKAGKVTSLVLKPARSRLPYSGATCLC